MSWILWELLLRMRSSEASDPVSRRLPVRSAAAHTESGRHSLRQKGGERVRQIRDSAGLRAQEGFLKEASDQEKWTGDHSLCELERRVQAGDRGRAYSSAVLLPSRVASGKLLTSSLHFPAVK